MRELFQWRTKLLVFQKDLFETKGCLCMVEEDVGFEIVFKTAGVNVCRATACQLVIAYQHLAVEKALVIEIYLDS